MPVRMHERIESTAVETPPLWIERASAEPGERCRARLLNISLGGAKLSVPTPPLFEEQIVLKLCHAEAGLDLALPGEVRWIRNAGDDGWTIGVAFAEPLDPATVDRMYLARFVDRRRARRMPIDFAAEVDWQLLIDQASVRLTDYSEGGFCMLAPNVGPKGARLKLLLGGNDDCGPHVAAATTRWHRPCGEGFLVGCEFLDKESCEQIRRRVSQPIARRRWRWKWSQLARKALVMGLLFWLGLANCAF